MSDESALRSLRRRLAMWILPEDQKNLRNGFRLVEYGLRASADEQAQLEASEVLVRLQMRLGIDPAEKPKPYNVEVKDFE